MDTQKINVAEEAKVLELQKQEKKSLALSYTWKIFLLLYTFLCLARVPFVASYTDGLIEYILGESKYVFYIVMIFVEISVIFHLPTEAVVGTKKFVAFFLLGLFALSCIISGIYDLIKYLQINPDFVDTMKFYHSNWVSYFLEWKYTNFINTGFISGGILAVLTSFLFTFLSYAVMSILGLLILVICIFAICNINYRSTKTGIKIRGWMIKKLGGTFRYDGFDELKFVKENQNRVKRIPRRSIIRAAVKNDYIPFELLPYTDLSHYSENFKRARTAQTKLAKLFKDVGIKVEVAEASVYTTFSEIYFIARSKKDLKYVLQIQSKISSTIRIDHFNINITGLTFSIEYTNPYFSKVSLKSASMLYDRRNRYCAIVGLNKTSKLIVHNFETDSSAIIIGRRGSGSSTLTILLALSMCYVCKPSELELVLLNPGVEAPYKQFIKLPHCDGSSYDDVNLCNNKLVALATELNRRKELFSSSNSSTIDEYNDSITTPHKLRRILLVISNFNNLLRDSYSNHDIIRALLTNGQKYGIYCVLHSYQANHDVMHDDIFKNTTRKYIMQLSTEAESMRIFNNQRGIQLHGISDCLSFAKIVKYMERIQICNLNEAELEHIVDIIKTFYEVKQQREEHV